MLVFMTDVTQILSQIESGDPAAAEELLPLVYDELRKLAAAKLAGENNNENAATRADSMDNFFILLLRLSNCRFKLHFYI